MPLYEVKWREYTERSATVALNDESEIADAVLHLAQTSDYEILESEELNG